MLRRFTRTPPYSCQVRLRQARRCEARRPAGRARPGSPPGGPASPCVRAPSRWRQQVLPPRRGTSPSQTLRVLRAGADRPRQAERLGHGLLQQVQRPLISSRSAGWLRRGFSRLLSCAWRSRPQRLVDVDVDLAAAAAIQSSTSGRAPGPARGRSAISASTPASSLGQLVGVGPGGPVAQRRPHDEVDGQADDHADRGVQQPTGQQVGLVDRVGGEHDDPGGRDRRRLLAPASGADPTQERRRRASRPCRAGRRRTGCRRPRRAAPRGRSRRSAGHRARRCGRRWRARRARLPTAPGRAARGRARRSR